ncbi:CID domain [Macleaya cordata]|uniref:CID domain n=1 Tax=Macleaya cordata TaxID=56857 RepID=A0A200PYP6_MACCD|nr:CID domain [Macleaya cordata]
MLADFLNFIIALSHWCIFHRTKAELVVATWDKQFHSSQKTNKIPFLYLANDILQNSKRKGNEFVSEFWKVLPAALKDVFENGDEHGKTVVSRLVGIWEERKVFGSRAQGLKDLMLGKESLPPLELNRKRSRAVRIVKRDSRSIRIKLAIGGTAEKIVSAFHSVLSEHPNEDSLMNNCKLAVHHVRKMEKDVDVACTKEGDPKRTTLANELQEEETLLKQCIEKLKSVEATRAGLVSQLKEALHEQESELENVRTQLQVAMAQAEEACNMRKRLNNETDASVPNPSSSSVDANAKAKTAAAIAAEVADRLAASTSSQQIMTSVLSSFAAQEAKNAGLVTATTSSNSFSSAPANSFTEVKPKLEKPMPVMDSNVFITAQPPTVPTTHSYQTVLMHQPSIQNQASTSQSHYHILANHPSQQQYLQPPGMLTGVPYTYSNLPPPPAPGPPPPPPPHMMNLAAAVSFTQQQPTPLIQQPPVPPSFRPLQPPTMLYYTHHHQPQ